MTTYLIVQIAVQLPVLAVLVVGLTLLATRRSELTSRAVGLGTAGCVVLLCGAITNVVWVISLPSLVDDGPLNTGNLALVSALVGLLSTGSFATGVGLLVAAVLTGRSPAASPYAPPSSSISATTGSGTG